MRASTSPCAGPSTTATNAAPIRSSRRRAAVRSSSAFGCKPAESCRAIWPRICAPATSSRSARRWDAFAPRSIPSAEFSYVAFAAGSGITPILSLATDILAREPRSRFTLIYGNRSISRTMFLEETLALKNRYMDRLSLHFVMSREPQHTELLNGRIDGKKVAELAQQLEEISSADEYLICGPGDMVDEVRNAVKALNGNAPIRFERFATANSRPLEILTKQLDAPAPQEVLATITVTMDGRRRSFPMSPSDPSVLDAAERAGLELPFSCRSGICATCRARITEGAAVMTHNIALERWETDAGFVLCCQARPTTPTLEISYDQK